MHCCTTKHSTLLAAKNGICVCSWRPCLAQLHGDCLPNRRGRHLSWALKTNSLQGHTSTDACNQIAALDLNHVHPLQKALPALQDQMAGEWGPALQAHMGTACTSQASWTQHATAPPQPPQKSRPAPCSAPPRDAWRRTGESQVTGDTSTHTALHGMQSCVKIRAEIATAMKWPPACRVRSSSWL